jgi:peroxiredoxin
MTYPQFHYLCLVAYVLAVIGGLMAFAWLVLAFAPKRIPARSLLVRRAMIGAVAAIAILVARHQFAEIYFWPQFEASEMARAEDQPETCKVKEGDKVASFSITTIDGEDILVANNDDKIVVLNFFATWCGPCVAEMPALEQCFKRYQENTDIQFVAVGREHDSDTISEFRSEHKLSIPMAADKDRQLFDMLAHNSIPRTIIILPNGTVCMSEIGYSNGPLWTLIAKLDLLLLMSQQSDAERIELMRSDSETAG